MMKINKILFTSSMMISIIATVSSYNWMSMWMGLEINLLSFIPLMNDKSSTTNIETSMKYFITQALASSMLMMAIIFMSMNWMFMQNIFNLALLMKMGAAPLHFWLPEVMEGLSWINCMLILTVQKIAPFTLLMMNTHMLMILVIVASMAISGSIGINQTSIRKMLAYSSINHIGWMLSASMMSKLIWMTYFMIYSIITINLIMFMNKFNLSKFQHLMSFNKNNMMKLFLSLNFLSLGGLPPFLGFFPKWMIIQTMIYNSMSLLALTMVMMTLITLFFYMRLTFNNLALINTILNYKIFYTNISYMSLTLNLISINSLIIFTMSANML